MACSPQEKPFDSRTAVAIMSLLHHFNLKIPELTSLNHRLYNLLTSIPDRLNHWG